ncbi:hypothetical protein AALA26_05725 [Bifidobacterium pseudolongum]|uniref:Viral A-type inclusion protein n=1 Tax=Bifidobacterium pseudolongum TaxID=1694 RepID=A0AB37NYI5_9BIFI|nr:hypothetical protein [Bifidobacterium pseudolongum]NBH69066.1 hypothetical protein [Bifidobacterium pseudolongum]RKI87961.1 hypothetical protein D7V89_05455 [Bifidobacterium pseudolongum]
MVQQSNKYRRSWGLFIRNNNGDGQFLRIIDYVTDAEGNGHYKWVAYENWWERSSTPRADNPKTLYNPNFFRIMATGLSDFRFLQWTPNYDRPDRPTVNFFQSGLHATVPPLYEVIDTPANSARELPHMLARGIQYSGHPTEKILFLFAGNNNTLEAAVLNREMVTIQHRTLTLSATAPNTVPHVKLKSGDIQTVNSRSGKDDRLVYVQPKLPESTSHVLIKPMQQMARSYVNWYIRKEQAMNSSELMRDAGIILERAFEKSENLEQYLGINPSPRDLRELQIALKATIHSNTEDVSAIIYNLMKQDDAIMSSFRQQAAAELADEFKQQKLELLEQLNILRGQRETQTKTVRQLTAQVKDLNEELQQKHREIRDAQAELELQEEERHKALQDLEENVALKIGLQQIAQQNRILLEEQASQRTPNEDQRFRSAPLMEPTKVQQSDTVQHALTQNLQALCCMFSKQRSKNNEKLAAFATQLCRTLDTTRLLAIDTAHAPAIANGLSFALTGVPAQHMGIPVDFSDFTRLETFLSNRASPVFVLDNVFDTVNESLLFALNRCHSSDTIVILPIGSFSNLRLVAPEVWQRVFYVPTEGMIGLPAAQEPELYEGHEKLIRKHADSNTVITQLSALRPTVKIAANAMVTPDEIIALGHGSDYARQWVMPHLCLETYAYQGLESAIALCQDRSNNAIAHKLTTLIDRIDHGSPAR